MSAKLVDKIATHEPSKLSIIADSYSLNYAALVDVVAQLAGFMSREYGPQPADRVILLFNNSLELLLGILALQRLDVIAVPVSEHTHVTQLEFLIRTLDCKLIVSSARFNKALDTAVLKIGFDQNTGQLEFEATPHPVSNNKRTIPDTKDIAFIRLSSGSTGVPKGIIITHQQQQFASENISATYNITPTHRELILSPMVHSDGWQRAAATLFRGGSLVISTIPASISMLLEEIQHHEVQGFFLPPPLLRLLLQHNNDLSASLKSCLSLETGSALLQASELEQLQTQLIQGTLFYHYGLTECTRACVLNVKKQRDKLHTVGQPLRNVTLKIVDDQLSKSPQGEVGQICLQAPQQTNAYWPMGDTLPTPFHAGWLLTGDYGSIDQDGFLLYNGRRDDRINSGGYSFFPEEAELLVKSHPVIKSIAFVGADDPRRILGHIPLAIVELNLLGDNNEKQSTTIAKLQLHFKSVLPSYMVPRKITLVPNMPMDINGKINRRLLLQSNK